MFLTNEKLKVEAVNKGAWMPNNTFAPPSMEVARVLLFVASMPLLKISISVNPTNSNFQIL